MSASWVPDPDAIRASNWYEAAGSRGQRRVESLIERGELHRRPQVRVATHSAPGVPWTLTPAQAATLLARPVRILVESADSDGTFIQRVLVQIGHPMLKRRLGSDTADLIRTRWVPGRGAAEWFEVDHGGGGTLPARLRSHAMEQAPGPLIIVVDSDRTHPAAPLGQTATKVQDACRECRRDDADLMSGWAPQVAVLKQREVENYIPDEALEAQFGASATAWLRALTVEQRSHWDHKLGLSRELEGEKGKDHPLSPEAWTWKDPAVQALFQGVGAHGGFVKGFGRDVWRAFLNDQHNTIDALRRRAGNEADCLALRIVEAL